jgi:hypothetical protein
LFLLPKILWAIELPTPNENPCFIVSNIDGAKGPEGAVTGAIAGGAIAGGAIAGGAIAGPGIFRFCTCLWFVVFGIIYYNYYLLMFIY